MVISRNASVALDLLRGSAALTVFIHHCEQHGLDGGLFAWARGDVGHSAVVIFFVLSGYVIASTLSPDATALDFAIRRMSRIYSVAVPAIVFSWMADLAVSRIDPALLTHGYQLAKPWIYVGLALTFSGDSWALGESLFSNGAYWSLNYEVWYYVAFGVFAFARGAWRVVGFLLVLALTGPKLWLLFPIWLGGAMVSRLQQVRPLSIGPARLCVAASIALLWVAKVWQWEQAINGFMGDLTGGWGGWHMLRFSQWFLGDHLIGGLTMVLVYALGSAEFRIPPLLRRPIVGLASVSFSLYLLHGPLIVLFESLLPGQGWATIVLTLACSLGLGALIEPQRTRVRRMLNDAAWRWAPVPHTDRRKD